MTQTNALLPLTFDQAVQAWKCMKANVSTPFSDGLITAPFGISFHRDFKGWPIGTPVMEIADYLEASCPDFKKKVALLNVYNAIKDLKTGWDRDGRAVDFRIWQIDKVG